MDTFVAALNILMRKASSERLLSGSSPLDMTVESNRPVPETNRWRSKIELNCASFSLRFEVAYAIGSARTFFAHSSGIPNDVVTDSDGQAFMNEFCNLVAGFAKSAFAEQGMELEIGLPILGEPYTDWVLGKNNESVDAWKITVTNTSILCFLSTKIIDCTALTALDLGRIQAFTNQPSVEIL